MYVRSGEAIGRSASTIYKNGDVAHSEIISPGRAKTIENAVESYLFPLSWAACMQLSTGSPLGIVPDSWVPAQYDTHAQKIEKQLIFERDSLCLDRCECCALSSRIAISVDPIPMPCLLSNAPTLRYIVRIRHMLASTGGGREWPILHDLSHFSANRIGHELSCRL